MTAASPALAAVRRDLSLVPAWWRSLSDGERRAAQALLIVNPGVSLYYLGVDWASAPYVMIAGALAVLWATRRFTTSTELGSTLRLLGGAFAVLFTLLPLWYVAALRYTDVTGWHRDALRLVSRSSPQAPLYGGPRAVEFWLGAVIVVPLVAAVVVWLLGRGDALFDRLATRRTLVVGYAALVAAFALTTSVARLTSPVVHYASFLDDSRTFASVTELFSTYVSRMPTLGFRTAHYPPGYLWLFLVERASGVPGLVKLLGYAAALGSVWLAAELARRLGVGERRTTFALALTVSSTGMLLFPSTSPETYVVFLAMVALTALHVAMEKGAPAVAILGGLALAGVTLLSFSVSFVGVLIALQAVFGLALGAYRLPRVLVAAIISATALVSVFVGLFWLTGFDLLACLRESIQNNQAGMSPSFDTPTRYLLRSTGNLLGYAGSLGPAIPAFVAAAVMGVRGLPPAQKALVLTAVAAPVAAAFSGLYFMETERIWLFFTPVLAVAGACAAERRGWSFAITWAVLFATVFELAFRHYR